MSRPRGRVGLGRLALVGLVALGGVTPASAAPRELSDIRAEQRGEAPPRIVSFRQSLDHDPAVDLSGSLDAAPIPMWTQRLPGKRLNAATHTERSAPLVVGDEVLLGSAGGEALYALDRADGHVVRTYPAAGSVGSQPVVSGGRVYFTDVTGSTWCYTLDGELVWTHASDAPILVSPVVRDGQVLVTNVDDLAIALDARTGVLRWRYQNKRPLDRTSTLALFAAPRPAVVAGLVLLGFSDGSLVAVDQATGDRQWQLQVGEGRYPDLVGDPLAYGDVVYVSGYLEPLLAIDVTTRQIRWRLKAGSAASSLLLPRPTAAPLLVHPGTDGTLRAIDALSGDVVWSWDSGTSGALTTPVATELGVVVGSSAGGVYAVDPVSGAEVWRYRGGRRLDGVSAAPAVDGRQLFVVTNAGRLRTFVAAPPAGERAPVQIVDGDNPKRRKGVINQPLETTSGN